MAVMVGLGGRHHGCIGIHPNNAASRHPVNQACGEVTDATTDIKNAAMGCQRLKPL